LIAQYKKGQYQYNKSSNKATVDKIVHYKYFSFVYEFNPKNFCIGKAALIFMLVILKFTSKFHLKKPQKT